MSVTLHLLVTSLCDRDCEYCCNKQYNLNDIPYVTEEELDSVEHVYITGGEPFQFTRPEEIARKLKREHTNINRVVVYTNAMELVGVLMLYGHNVLSHLDGLNISIKTPIDKKAFEDYISRNPAVLSLPYNRLYVFPGFEDTKCPESFAKIRREWQKEFVPAPNCIFRRI